MRSRNLKLWNPVPERSKFSKSLTAKSLLTNGCALKDLRGKAKIEVRINRIRRGNLGDHDELRIDFGPGYRVYCAEIGETILVLCAGAKKSQRADIMRAKTYWQEYNS